MRGRASTFLYLALGLAVAGCRQQASAQAAVQSRPGPVPQTLSRPEALGLLEDPDRDEWQQPDRVMDELHIADGSHVGDVGAGGGWFTTRLARRVGPNGVVYAEDVQKQMIEAITQRAHQEGLTNIRPILSSSTDPMLPSGLDAALVVNAYSQLAHPIDVLRHVAASLGQHGRLGVVDFKPDSGGGPGPPVTDRIDPERIVADAARAGLVLQSRETSLRYQYLLIFGH